MCRCYELRAFRTIKINIEIVTTLLHTVLSRLLWTSFLLYIVGNDATKSSNEKRTMKVTFILVFINIVTPALTSDVISAGKLNTIITVLMSNYILLNLLSVHVYSFQETNPNYHQNNFSICFFVYDWTLPVYWSLFVQRSESRLLFELNHTKYYLKIY